MTEYAPIDFASLRFDGDTVSLPNGRMLRFRSEPDYDTQINDYDCYGKVEWSGRNYGYPTRPSGFDGSACVVMRDRNDTLWWMPPDDLKSFKAWGGESVEKYHEVVRNLRKLVENLCEYGFSLVILELCDADGNVIRDTYLGGVDSIYPELFEEMYRELDPYPQGTLWDQRSND